MPFIIVYEDVKLTLCRRHRRHTGNRCPLFYFPCRSLCFLRRRKCSWSSMNNQQKSLTTRVGLCDARADIIYGTVAEKGNTSSDLRLAGAVRWQFHAWMSTPRRDWSASSRAMIGWRWSRATGAMNTSAELSRRAEWLSKVTNWAVSGHCGMRSLHG